MSQKYLIRIAELERLLSEQAEALRQKDQQLSLVEETEAFLRSALTRAEEKIEEDEREIEHLRAQIEKLRRMLFGTRKHTGNCVNWPAVFSATTALRWCSVTVFTHGRPAVNILMPWASVTERHVSLR